MMAEANIGLLMNFLTINNSWFSICLFTACRGGVLSFYLSFYVAFIGSSFVHMALWPKSDNRKSSTQVEVARPNWALIRPSSSAHMFSVRSNYMVWKRLRAHFCLDNGLELAWSEATLVWDGLIRGHFGLGRSDQRQFQAHTSLTRDHVERIFFQVFFYWHSLSLVKVNKKNTILIQTPYENLMSLIRTKGSSW